MGLLREYTTGIIVVSVLAILLENILPNTHHKKYINVTIGLVVMLVIVSPLARLPNWQGAFVLPEMIIDDNDLSGAKPLVAEEFERRLSGKLSEEVQNRCGKRVAVSVSVDVNEKGEITGIREITAYPLDDAVRAAIAESSGIELSKIREGDGR